MSVNQVPVRPASRNAVYDVIDGERDYQDAGSGNAARHDGDSRSPSPAGAMSMGDLIACMEETLSHARAAWYKGKTGLTDCLPFIRKTATLGVKAMELYGAPPREWHVPPSANITGEMHIIDKRDAFN